MKIAALSLSAVLLASTAYGAENVDIRFPLVAGGVLSQVTPSNPLPVNPGALSFGSPQALVTSANPLPVEPGPLTYQSGAVAVPVSPSTPLPVVDASQTMAGVGIDGSTTVNQGTPTTLFGGVVPPHGWMVYLTAATCGTSTFGAGTVMAYVSDSSSTLASGGNGIPLGVPTNFGGSPQSPLVPSYFITPPGYHAPGPVSVASACTSASIYARAW